MTIPRRFLLCTLIVCMFVLAGQASASNPILVVTNTAKPFTAYLPEILKAEGMNAFDASDLSGVTANQLSAYSVVILGESALSPEQAGIFSTWVNAGGTLIAMRPDAQLAGLMGLTGPSGTMQDAYLLVNTSTQPGRGIVAESIQYHGTADLYALNGATAIATLYSNSSTPTINPAITSRAVGAGQAVAFTYDLARSVVYTRQGNPAWSGQERDGIAPIRSDDLFFGAKSGDVQADWVDLTKVAIPQADEQQRLLINVILQVSSSTPPLPRFWYLPKGLKAAIVMTGDDHGTGGTGPRFDQFIAASPANCSVADWECIRGSSYVYPETVIADPAGYESSGFEIGLHVNNGCVDFNGFAGLDSFYQDQLSAWSTAFPQLTAPVTNRTHCVVWSDYDTQPQVELSHGIRFDTNYYYYPGEWVNNKPGLFTGSGMPMKFMTSSGSLVDVYQATTQMSDESNQSYPNTVNELLKNALGPQGYYGVFTANLHTDLSNVNGAIWSGEVVSAAKAAGVPVVSSSQMLHWLDGRNNSSFTINSWQNSTLGFSITAGAGARNLQAILPANAGGAGLSSLSRDGQPLSFTLQSIKGIQYAMFAATTAAYTATYGGNAVYSISGTTAPASSLNGTTVAITGPVSASTTVDQYGAFSFVGLPAGSYTVTPAKAGGTFSPASQSVAVGPDVDGLNFTFTASGPILLYPEPTGWFAGDPHTHRSCGGPPEAVSSIFQKATDQNLAVVSLLADMGNGEVENPAQDLPRVTGGDDAISTAGHILHWDAEWHWDATFTQYPHQALGGHVVALGLTEAHQIWEESTFPIFSWAHQQNGIAGFAHLQYLDVGIPQGLNCCAPLEYPIEVGLGTADFISEDVNGSDAALLAYYRLLNSGMRPGFAGGSDYPCSAATLGTPLTYVRVANGNMSYRNWIEGIANGRTVISRNGHNEFLELTVNGTAGPGDEVQLTSGGTVQVDAKWTANGDYSGTIELVVNGVVVASQPAAVTSSSSSTLSRTLTFAKSGWIVARRMGNNGHVLHTAAVFVNIDNLPVRANSVDPEFYVSWIDDLLAKTSAGGEWNSFFPNTLTQVQQRYQSARAVYEQISQEAQGAAPTLLSIAVTPSNQNIVLGSTQQFTATGTYSDASSIDITGQVKWASSNSTVAPVNLRGLVSGTNIGTAVISATLGAVSGSSTVATQPMPVSITTGALPDGTAGIAFSTTLAASGGTQPYTWSIASGALPNGLGLNSATGVISGIPGASGAFDITFNVTDSGAQNSSKTLTLTVTALPTGPYTIWPSTAAPTVVDGGPDSPVELGVKFKSDIEGYVTAIRFYKGAANTGLHVGNLWTLAGTKLATVTFSGESASGWQQANLATPVAITPGTVYVVSYHANNGHYPLDHFYFQQGFDNTPLHALADGEAGPNGVFVYGSTSAFPDQSFETSNYWVDAVISATLPSTYTITGMVTGPGAAGTTINLTGLSTASTASDATGSYSFSGLANSTYTLSASKTGYTFTPTTQNVTINGADSTSLDFVSVANATNFSIAGTISGPAAINAKVTLSGAATATATSDSAGQFIFTNLNDGLYTVTVSKPGFIFSPPDNDVTVNGSDVLGVDFTSSENTPAVSCPCSIWDPSTVPTITSSNDLTPVELGVRFRSSADGTITGIRFYKGANNTGTHIGNLWSNTGTLIASATFTNETASGWQEVSFDQPVSIVANTTYVASYHTDAGAYSLDTQYFGSNYNNAPLQALANDLDGANGVFRYGPSAFPDSTFQNSNYWVDVVLAQPTYSVSGTISGPGGNLATVALSGSATSSTITDASGHYAFLGLANGSYTVTPTKAGFRFSPANQSVTVSGASQTAVDFGSAVQLWNINGTITGAGASGATVTLTGATTLITTADAGGNFIFSVPDGAYTVTPSNTGFEFTPPSQNLTVDGADTSASFTAGPAHYAITGTISGAGANGGVTMTLSGDSTATTTTDVSGNYTFSVLDGSYTVTPSKIAYDFTPANQPVTVSGAAVANVNFTAIGGTATSTLFHDDFDRTVIGGSYDIGTTGSYAVPLLDGATFGTSNQNLPAIGLVQPAAAIIGADQFARATLVNVSSKGGSSLYLRATLLPDKSDLLSGYEVDFGHTWNNQGDWWNIYYKDPIAGWQTVKSAYPSPAAIPPGSVVEFRAAGQMLQLVINGQIVWTGLGFGNSTGAPGVGVYGDAVVDEFLAGSFVSAVPTYSISGTLTGAGVIGSTVTLTGAAEATTLADVSGNYAFTGLMNGNYTVTASKDGFDFSPLSQNVPVNGAAVTDINFAVTSAPTETTLFTDDFNRTELGNNYDVPTGPKYVPSVMNGSTFGSSDASKSSVALLLPPPGAVQNDQSARITLVNVTKTGISSLFVRATLKADKSDIDSGYEVDLGRLFDDSGDWWAIYYFDPVAGVQQVHVTYPSRVSIPAGSVVEFRASGDTLKLIINGQVAWSGIHTGASGGAPGFGAWGDAVVDDFVATSATATPPFHDDFNRTTIGGNYDIASGASKFAPPVMDGATFSGATGLSSVAILSPTAATLPNDQFARLTTVNLTRDGISSLFLRATLLPDKSDLQSGYELDMGRLFDDSGDWWAIYYIDPVLGYQQIHVTFPSRVSIPPGSVVEFSATGNTLKLVINGQTAWTGTDSNATVGAPGIGAYGTSPVDDFYAGRL